MPSYASSADLAIFSDNELAGFGVRVHATGRKTYVVQSRGPTGPTRVTLGLHGDLSADEARKQAAVVIDRIKRGEDPVPVVPETELTVAALAERFMRVHVDVHCKPRTIDTYRGVLKLHIMPALGGMVLSAVGRREIAALHHGLRDKPCTANAAVRVASSMFQRAEAWELVPPGRNPCRSVRRYKQHSRERFLTPEEYRCLGRALSEAQADGSVWPPAIAAIRLLMLTGSRRHSEILTLRWDDVDRTAGELRLRDAKTGSRMVPMTAPVAVVLDGLRREPGLSDSEPAPVCRASGTIGTTFVRRLGSTTCGFMIVVTAMLRGHWRSARVCPLSGNCSGTARCRPRLDMPTWHAIRSTSRPPELPTASPQTYWGTAGAYRRHSGVG